MPTTLFLPLNLLLLAAGFLGLGPRNAERRFSLALLPVLAILPLLAVEYLTLANHPGEATVMRTVLFSETVFALLWLSLAARLRDVSLLPARESRTGRLVEGVTGLLAAGTAAWFLLRQGTAPTVDGRLVFPLYSPFYFAALFLLLAVLYAAWRLEQFWRALKPGRRRGHQFLVVGGYLVCGAMAWAASYRLTYLVLMPAHLTLLAALLLLAWGMLCYAVARHRLLNRKIFVSRKVVYPFVVPSLLAAYLLGFGLVVTVMRVFGLELSFVLRWMVVAVGLVAAALLAISPELRRRVRFFVSTHFYVNKYEYRDEWLALSERLQGALDEGEVIEALRGVMAESLYTSQIFLWLGDAERGYRLVSAPAGFDPGERRTSLAPGDPLVRFLQEGRHLYLREKRPDRAWREAVEAQEGFLRALGLELLSPLAIGGQLVGLIGLGPEFTGEAYGHDDFDLLTALGTQAASAILASRVAEQLAHAREQQAWNRLSAFVLHDIKNAASMLSLLRENAPEHLHEPEFQRDLLELVDDALRRMGRVEQRLRTLKDQISPEIEEIDLTGFLEAWASRMEKKLPTLRITTTGVDGALHTRTDARLLASILENLLLNAHEAGGGETRVEIRAHREGESAGLLIEVADNGPGIPAELLPDLLFEPFKTTRAGGSGIGLWQARRMAVALGGEITAENAEGGGARFLLRLPPARGPAEKA